MTTIILTAEEIAALQALRELAAANPFDVVNLEDRLKVPAVKVAAQAQLERQRAELSGVFVVYFTIEEGLPSGTCRHMTIGMPGSLHPPFPASVAVVAAWLGFVGVLETNDTKEFATSLNQHRISCWMGHDGRTPLVNLLQPVAILTPPTTMLN